MEKNFDYFNEKIKPCKKRVNHGIFFFILSIISILIFLYMKLVLSKMEAGFIVLFIVLFAIALITIFIGLSAFDKVNKEFNNIYLLKLVHEFYPGAHYDADKGFEKEEIYHSKVLKKEGGFRSFDSIEGEFDNIKFKMSGVELTTTSDPNSTTKFLGKVYRFQFNKKFRSNIIINQRTLFDHVNNFRIIDMESVQFNSKFIVYAGSKEEAFYVLTPQLMEKLLELNNKYHYQINFSFFNDQIYIAINYTDASFKLPWRKPVDETILEGYREQLKTIQDFILDLRLEENIFE